MHALSRARARSRAIIIYRYHRSIMVYHRYLLFLVSPPVSIYNRVGAHACDVAAAAHARACAWLPQPGTGGYPAAARKEGWHPESEWGGRLCSPASAHATNIPANCLDTLLPTGFQSQTCSGVIQDATYSVQASNRVDTRSLYINAVILDPCMSTLYVHNRFLHAVSLYLFNNIGYMTIDCRIL